MEIDVSYAVMARALRKGSRVECRLLGSIDHRQKIPEVSASSTREVTSPLTIFNPTGDKGDVGPLRMYQNKLYRYIVPLNPDSSKFGISLPHVISRAFFESDAWRDDFVYTSGGRIFCARGNRSPFSRPVFTVFRDRLEALGMTGSNSRNRTHPRPRFGNNFEDNEGSNFYSLASRCEWVNPSDVEEARAMHKAQSSRLLIIDDALWYETKPPCIAVETHWDHNKPSASSVYVRYRYLPDTMDQTPSSHYFPLEQLELARETAHRIKNENRMLRVVDKVEEVTFEDHPSFKFDTVEDLVNRTGHAVALSLLGGKNTRRERIDLDTSAWLDGIEKLFHSHNPVIGVDVDFASLLPDLVDTYLRLDAPKYGGMIKYQKAQLRKMLPSIVDALGDLPVALPSSQMKPSFGL